MIDNFADLISFDVDHHMASLLFDISSISHRVSIYVEESQSCRPPFGGELPWTVIMLCSAFSRKHVFVDGRKPKMPMYGRALARLKCNLRKHYAAAAGGIIRAEDDAFVQDLISNASHVILKSISSCRGTGLRVSNTPAFVKHGLDWLKRSDYTVVPNDKEGQYTLVRNRDLDMMLARQIQLPHYEEVNPDFIPQAALNDLVLLARKLDPADCHTILRFIRVPLLKVGAPLQYTIKTHKNPGEVKLRLLHGASRHPYTGVGIILNRIIQPILDELPHLCRSSTAMRERLESKQYPSDSVFCKMDIDNFYMEAQHRTLVDCAFRGVSLPPAKLEILKSLLTHVLHFQYVFNPRSNRWYQVKLGSGMGLNFSGCVSNKCFYELAERPWMLSNNVQSAFGVHNYCRYHDDSITVASHPESFVSSTTCEVWSHHPHWHGRQHFWNSWSTLERFIFGAVYRTRHEYRLKIEEVSSIMRVLDMYCMLNRGRVLISPYVKCVDRPYLSCRSAHHYNIHVSWPKANLSRIRQLCCNQETFARAKAGLLARYASSDVHHLGRIAADLPYAQIVPRLSFMQSAPAPAVATPDQMWIVLRYHPVIEHRALRSSLAATINKWGKQLNIIVAYRNAGPNLMNVLQFRR